jgi:hypothetical protein
MVAYKKFTKAERESVVRTMTKNVIEKEYKPIMSNVENELTSLFMKDIPNDVFEFEKKYPHLIDKGDVTLYGYDFLTKEDKEKYNICGRWNYAYLCFHVNNIYNKMIDGVSIHEFQLNDTLVKYIKKNAPEIAEKIKAITIKRLDLQDWSDKLSCTLGVITTINKLKEEFPEAYTVYVKLYGEPGSPCKKVKDDKGNETSMCDNIEKLRAEYNKVVDNKEVDKK